MRGWGDGMGGGRWDRGIRIRIRMGLSLSRNMNEEAMQI